MKLLLALLLLTACARQPQTVPTRGVGTRGPTDAHLGRESYSKPKRNPGVPDRGTTRLEP